MKLINLEIEGVNSFKNKTKIGMGWIKLSCKIFGISIFDNFAASLRSFLNSNAYFGGSL